MIITNDNHYSNPCDKNNDDKKKIKNKNMNNKNNKATTNMCGNL